jgi:hypothetical protein
MSSETERRRSGTDDGADPGLRYHLNMLYGLRAVPDEFMQLARELERRLRTQAK